MEVGLRGNRGDNLIQVISGGTNTLRPGFEYWVTGAADLWLPPSGGDGRRIMVTNSTASSILVSSTGGATISGIRESNGAVLAATDRVRILPGQRGLFVASGGNWIAQGCEPPSLVFTYNGTPLSSNTSNPLNAGGLFHYLGIVQGSGTWVNPANTAVLTSAASAMESGTVAQLTDRVASGQNVFTTDAAGSWVGWRTTRSFRPTGFIFQTRSLTGYFRSFQIRLGVLSALTTGQSVADLPIIASFANQNQISAANTYYLFEFANTLAGNTLVVQTTAADTLGTNRLFAQEFEWFGDLDL